MPIAVTASSLTADPRRLADAALQAGFEGLLFEPQWGEVDLTTLSDTGVREFRHVVTRSNLALVGLQAELGPRGFSPGTDVDRLLSQCGKLFDTARKLQATVLCLALGALPEPPPAPPPPRPRADEAGLIFIPESAPPPPPTQPPRAVDPALVAQVDAALIELGRLADRFGVNVAMRSDLASLAALQRALAAARCPWFGVDLNPAAVLCDDWSLDDVFSHLGPQVRHVRGRDAVAGADRRTKPMPVGLGDTAWDHLLENLAGVDYRGWITADPVDLPDRPAAAVKALRYIRLHQT